MKENSELSQSYNRLIYWLSATGEGTSSAFANVCHTLGLINDTKQAQNIQRRLILLGHIERSKDGSRWSVCPPTLVQNAVNSKVRFFCGQRTPKIIEQISKLGELETLSQPQFNGPDCIRIISSSLEGPETIRLTDDINLNVAGADSPRLSELLPYLKNWKEFLDHLDRLNTSNYEIKRWDGKSFLSCTDFYERNNQYFGNSGFYCLTQRSASKTNPRQLYLYFDQNLQKWFEGDFFGLRFLAHHLAGIKSTIRLNKITNTLRIPEFASWPRLYERPLVLASGFLPIRLKETNELLYQDILESDAEELARKLGIKLEYYDEYQAALGLSEALLNNSLLEDKDLSLTTDIALRIRWLVPLILTLGTRGRAEPVPLQKSVKNALNKLKSMPGGETLAKITFAPLDLLPHLNALAKRIDQIKTT